MPNYFDETSFRNNWILNQSLEPGKQKAEVEAVLAKDILAISKAIIYRHAFLRFKTHSLDELMSLGFEACWSSLPRFKSDYISKKTGLPATYFNYLSLVVKRALMFETVRENTRRRHIDNLDIDDHVIVTKDNTQDLLLIEGVKGEIKRLIKKTTKNISCVTEERKMHLIDLLIHNVCYESSASRQSCSNLMSRRHVLSPSDKKFIRYIWSRIDRHKEVFIKKHFHL